MIGQTVSHYLILEKLGEGGMGVLYRAQDTKLRRTVALKFLPLDLTRDAEARSRFIQEAQAASALQHHNICTIHEIDETAEGQLFISMDCYDGETLRQKVARGPLPVREALGTAAQVAEGLSAAHEAGMVHRDIKPANIIVTKGGVAKILDFGLARLAGQERMTRTGTAIGTLAYMSPEQVRGEPVDARSDIFSLGALLYEMLSGRLPFPGDHEAGIMYSIMSMEPRPLASIRSDVPAGVQDVVDKALKKAPSERYQSVLELLDDVDELIWESAESGSPNGMRGSRQLRRASQPSPLPVTDQVSPDLALAVMDFRDLATPDDPTVSAGITELVTIGLIEASPVRVISAEYLHDLRRRIFGSGRGPIEEDEAIEIARQAGAVLLLGGGIGRVEEAQFVTWRLVNSRNGAGIGARRVQGEKLTELADQVIADVVPLVAGVAGVKQETSPAAVGGMTTESTRAYQHYVAGVLAAEEGRHEDAVSELERAVTLDSSFALAHTELAKLYWGTKQQSVERASEHAAKAWSVRSKLGVKDRMRLEALRHDLGFRMGEALDVLYEMLERWPEDRQVLIELQSRLFFRWYFSEAIEVSEKGRRLYPDDLTLSGSRFIASLGYMGRIDEAVRAAESFVERHPNEAAGWDYLGEILLWAGSPDKAEEAYRRSTQLGTVTGPEAFVYCAHRRGDLSKAIGEFERLLKRENLSEERKARLTLASISDVGLAALYVEAGRHRKAFEACQEYMSRTKDQWIASSLGGILLAVGRVQEASAIAEEMLGSEAAVVRFSGLRLQARVMLALGDVDSARKVANEMHSSEDDYGRHARMYALKVDADIALAENLPESAMDALNEMMRIGVGPAAFFYVEHREAMARAHQLAGRLEEAARVHTDLLRIFGGHAVSHYELGRLYEEMGRCRDARTEHGKFLDMWSAADEGLPTLTDARGRLAQLQT